MPQFHIDLGCDSDRWAALSEFERGYLECAFWLADEELEGPTFADLAPEALEKAKADCADFIASNATALERAYNDPHGIDYTESRAGHDFFLTRNHHGVGFWDRGLGAVGGELTKAAHAYGEADLYKGDDGNLYF